ncbi:MAB_1171c family putative transporter [Streptomyces blattellae]|uniref:MAB_1171c family putative transporter n=1 Tax=Streptomyces blattellae TaxID=2569855 RepID=UPI0012B99DDF|nr:MAB_1171c family putative transporter [Streptomyces blattellae]
MNPYFHIPYAIPTLLLALALLLKFPTLVRAWRDPDVRATTLLLTFATAVLVVITPVNIELLNELTGIPNIASPWAYSFLTAFCATGLTMIMRWREEPSERRRRRIRRVYWIYAGIIAALWVTFVLADVPEPRIYDLDTYYASTPWMREHILLYLLAHMVSSLVATYMLWKWFPEVANRWLKSGVVCLQLGFASGLIFDAAKLTALGAHWSGHDLDVLSTQAAPPFALLEAILVAIGFIVPQAGPLLQKWLRDQREYWRLRPLWSAVRDVTPAAAPARLGLWVPLDLRLVQRQQRIHDSLRVLAPYLDRDLYDTARRAVPAGCTEQGTRGIAGAVTIRAAIDAHRGAMPGPTSLAAQQLATDIHEHIDAISKALHRPRLVDSIRQRVTSTESVNTHAS